MIVKTLKPLINVFYNNKNITEDISEYVESVVYRDFEENQSDELTITLNDTDKLFQNSWYPSKGDKISAKIGHEGQELLDCGIFTIDEPEIILSDTGDKMIINSLSASINQKLRELKSKSYVNKTLIDIAKEKATEHGYTVRGSAGFIKIPYAVQYQENDMAFLRRLAKEYGYIFKLTDTIITFIPVETLETTSVLTCLYRKDIKHAVFRDCGTKTYSACSAKYLNPKTGKLISYTAHSDNKNLKTDTLKLSEKYSTKEAAIRAANAGLKKGSTEVVANIDLVLGNAKAIAGTNFDIKFDIIHDGKFHITQSSHSVTKENYETSIEVKKVA